MPTLAPDVLLELTRRIFAGAGADDEEATVVATSLVQANLRGHDSHGVIRIPQYLDGVEAGRLIVGAPVEVVAQTAASACLDAHWGFGQVAGHRAAQIGLAQARQVGVAAVTVRHSGHMGRIGEYAEALARQGAVSLLFCNLHGSGALAVPWGGRQPRLATNPVAAGLPRPGGGGVVLDMATSAVAEGKVRVRRNREEPVPAGWILDGDGQPTTDPNDFYDPDRRGSLLPLGGRGGYKGYGLSVAAELLAGALGRAGTTHRQGGRLGNGLFLLVVDVAQFVPLSDFTAAVDDLAAFLKSSALAPGYDEILLPGDKEEREAQRRGAAGIWIENETWDQVLACAERVGARLPGKA